MKKRINLFTDLFENKAVINNPANVFDALIGFTKTAVNEMIKALEEAGADMGNRKGKTRSKKMSDFYTNADALLVVLFYNSRLRYGG